jgi:glycosyltransferase involved in cell wall biosynthesis
VLSSQVGKTPEEHSLPFVFDEVYRLAKRGIRVHVVRTKIERDCISYGVYFHGLEKKADLGFFGVISKNITEYPLISLLRQNFLQLYWENLYALNAIRIAKKNTVDVIHAHFAYPEGFVGVLVKNATRKPLVITCHGYDINTVPEIGYGVRLRKEYDALVHTALRRADAVISVSTRTKEKIVELGADPEKVFVILNGVDLELFRPPNERDTEDLMEVRKRFEVSEDEFLILNARHLYPVYGIHYLIYAMKIITQRVKNVKLIIAGEGPLRKTLLELAQKLEVNKYVRFVGTVPRTLMPKLMQASSIYVNASLSDTTPISLIEATASGLPIVSSDVGGISDVVINGFNGFLCPPRDPKAIADIILYLLENPSEIKRVGLNGRKLSEERFNIERKIDKIVEIYRKLVERWV